MKKKPWKVIVFGFTKKKEKKATTEKEKSILCSKTRLPFGHEHTYTYLNVMCTMEK